MIRYVGRLGALASIWLFTAMVVSATVPEGTHLLLDPQRNDLRSIRPVSAAEQQAFDVFMGRFSHRLEHDDFSAADAFLSQFPQGAWAHALNLRLAEEYYKTGWYSRAVRTLEELWEARGRDSTAAAALLDSRTGVQLAELYARLGRREDVERVLAVLDQGSVGLSDLETVRGVKQGLATMKTHPELAARCGALALERIRVSLSASEAGHPALMNSKSSLEGMSLAEVAALSETVGMHYQMAFRAPGAPLVTPAVMHLGIGHYVALIREVHGKVQIEDPTGWQSTFASRAAIEAEASGYFLVPQGPLPRGWRRVEPDEAAGVFGRNGVLDNDPDATTKRDQKARCGGDSGSSYGMATWDLHLALISQEIEDTPIGYQPPFGPPVGVTFRHVQRANQRFGFKPTWTHNWTGQIYEDPYEILGDLWIQEEGGWERFSALDEEGKAYQGRIFNTGRITRPDTQNLVWTFPDGSQKSYTTFTGPDVPWGRVFYLSGLTDPAGNRVTIQVQPNGRVDSITDPLGRVTRFFYELPDPGMPPNHGANVTSNYDYTNQVTRIEDPFGRTAVLHYAKVERSIGGYCTDQSGTYVCPFFYYNYDLTNITDVAGLNSQFAYDATGSLITDLTTPYGTTHFEWVNAYAGNYTMDVTDPEGETERFSFGSGSFSQALWKRPQGMRTDGGGMVVSHWGKKAYAESFQNGSSAGSTIYLFQLSETFDSAGRVLEAIKQPLENAVWFNYPGQGAAGLPGVGNRPSRTGRVLDDGSTQLWQTDRDAWGNVVRSVDPLGRTRRYVYADNFIDLLEVRQVVGNQEEQLLGATWNAQHRPLTITDAAGGITRFTYNVRGQVTSIANALNEITTFVYDGNGFLTAIDGPLAGTQDRNTFTYDAVGRVRTATDSDGYTLIIDYDALDRITKLTFPDGTSQDIAYDRMEVGTVRDRLGRETHFDYDGLRRIVAVQDAIGRVTQFQWCGCGSLGALVDPLGRLTQWHRDIQGRVIAKEFADGSKVRFDYEQTTSRLRRKRDEQNQITEFGFNLANELVSLHYLGSQRPTPDVSFAYDSSYSRLVSMSDGNGLTRFQYRPVDGTPGAGRIASVDGPWANDEITYTYDQLGRVVTRAINGVAVRHTYDAAGRMTRMTNALGGFDFTFDGATERLSGVNYPNGQRSEFAYAGNLREQLLQRVTHFLPNGAKLSEFSYGYNAQVMITNWTQLQAGRLKTWSPSYDSVNRLTNIVEVVSAGPPTVTGWTYDAADNRTAERTSVDQYSFTFNALNQLTAFSNNTPITPSAYEWDAENRLIAVSNATSRVEFAYDGLDRRTRITVKNSANVVVSDRRYLWCGTQLCEERDATGGAVLKRYSSYGELNLAAPEIPLGAYFFTRDHLGSIREMTTTAGNGSVFDYTSFGEQRRLAGVYPSEIGFTGHFQNPDGATWSAPYRTYAPGLARWLSRDPQGEAGGINLYAYVELDPINRVDPLGYDWRASISGWVDQHPTVSKWTKKLFQKTKVGKVEKQFEDFDEQSEKILDTEIEVKEALDDPDCGHSGAKLLRTILGWLPKSIQLGPINNADLFRKTLDEGVNNEDAYFDRLNQRTAEALAGERN